MNLRNIILIALGCSTSGFSQNSFLSKVDVQLFNTFHTNYSKVISDPNEKLPAHIQVGSGFTVDPDLINLGLRIRKFDLLHKRFYYLDLSTGGYTTWYKSQVIEGKSLKINESGRSAAGSTVHQIGAGAGFALNRSEKDPVSLVLGGQLIINRERFPNWSISGYSKDSFNETQFWFGDGSRPKTVLAITGELQYEHRFHNLVAGIGLLAQYGLIGNSLSELIIIHNDILWKGKVRMDYTSVGIKIFATIWSGKRRNLLFQKINSD